MKVADLKTLEGFKLFFQDFTDQDFIIKDYSDHESCSIQFSLAREFEAEDDMWAEANIVAFAGKSSGDIMGFNFYDSEGETYEEYTLTEEQKDYVYEALNEMLEYVLDAKAEAAEYNRDIYAYHGVRRSDFY